MNFFVSFCAGAGAFAAPWCCSSRVVEQHRRCYLCCEAIVICATTQLCLLAFLGVVFGPSFFGTQLSAMDVSARTTMKGAAKCDKHCELQNSVNQWGFERILCIRDIPGCMPASVSPSTIPVVPAPKASLLCVFVCQGLCGLDSFIAWMPTATTQL